MGDTSSTLSSIVTDCRKLTLLHLAVKKFADDVVAPRVEEMDENEKMDPAIIKGLFDQGVRLPTSSPSSRTY